MRQLIIELHNILIMLKGFNSCYTTANNNTMLISKINKQTKKEEIFIVKIEKVNTELPFDKWANKFF